MKVFYKVKWIIILLIFAVGCKRENHIAPEFASAYARFVVIDAPGNGKVQFYLDGKVNANGDSVIHNPDGTLYQPDKTQNSTVTINYPSGGWTDNSPINLAGTFGYYNNKASSYSIFPNPSNRIQLAPIVNNFNYYNWAALPADQHQLSFYSVINADVFGNPISIRGDRFFNQAINLEGGALQTFFLINKSVCKQYVTIQNDNTETGLPIYAVKETINYFTNQFDLVSVKDHPAKLPQFKDSSAYVRFINVTPKFSDQSINENTESVDIYIAPLFGLRPNIYSRYGSSNTNLIDSIGDEVLVSRALERYQSSVDAPFFEINVAANMRKNKITGMPDTLRKVGKPRVPRYYRVLAYRSGQSRATGNAPVGQGDWLAVYNQFPGTSYFNSDYPNPLGVNMVDSWLVRSDGTNFHSSICTIALAIDLNQVPYADGTTNYLGFRSCINYQRTGTNGIFYQK